jgi:hypothetical protein
MYDKQPEINTKKYFMVQAKFLPIVFRRSGIEISPISERVKGLEIGT